MKNSLLLEEKENNVVDLSQGKVLTTITGGKGGGEDWLSKLPVSSAFLTRDPSDPRDPNNSNPTLTRWAIEEKTEKSVKLAFELPNGEEAFKWFIPGEFCKIFQKWEVIHEGPVVEAVHETEDKGQD